MKNIALIEPFYTGSHKTWAEGLRRHSRHNIRIFSLPGKYWKWRMHGGAISLARQLLESGFLPDMILATDMLNLPIFIALIRVKMNVPVAVYFHENQLDYPWSGTDSDRKDKKDYHYHFINYSSALSADKVFFNSRFHRHSFIKSLDSFLRMFPDKRELWSVEQIEKKSSVLHLGMDLLAFDPFKADKSNQHPLILWNHRWEYDKDPERFFQLLFDLEDQGFDFRLVVLGEKFKRTPEIFNVARSRLDSKILHWGFVESFEEYARWLWRADLYPVTSQQDFFGASVVEAMYTGSVPLLPDRLAYPEHLPDSAKWCLYRDTQQLHENMKQLLQGDMIPDIVGIRQHVRQYDWAQIIGNYDEQFDNFL